jgi:hypothetical protein
MAQQLEQAVGEDENFQQFGGVIRAAFGQAFTAAEQFLNDATAAGVSLHLNDQGLSTTVVADFKPDSYFAKLAGQIKNTEEPLTAGLPAGQYFLAGGMVNAPEVAERVMSDLLDPITKELAATEQGKGFAEAAESYKQWFKAAKSFTFRLPRPQGDLGAESMLQSVAIAKGDAKAMQAATTKIMKASSEMMAKMAPEGQDAGAEVRLHAHARAARRRAG